MCCAWICVSGVLLLTRPHSRSCPFPGLQPPTMPRRVLKLPVVLKRTVPGLGRAGDTVEVAHGRARNELFPRGLIEYKYTGRPPPKKGLEQIGTLLRTASPLQTGLLTARNAPNTSQHT